MSAEESAVDANDGATAASPRAAQLLRLVDSEPSARSVAEPADDALDAAAQEIRQYVTVATLAIACTVGRIVLDRFYGGDVAAWHAHGRKPVSLRKLAERLKDAHFTASGLSRCMAIHAALEPLGPVTQWRRLTPRHVAVVLPLPPAEQAALLRAAEESDWTAKELKEHARVHRPVVRRGHPAVPRFVSAIHTILRMTEPDGAAFAELENIGALSAEALFDLYQQLMRARANLDRLQRAIDLKRAGVMRAARRGAGPLRGRASRSSVRE